MTTEATKVQIQFKDPDTIFDIVQAKVPFPDDEDDVTPRMEREREEFSDKYFEYGDYGRIEVDVTTMAARLIPRDEWR